MMNTNEHIALKWFDAFNEHNIDNLLALYDDQAEHYSPKLKVRHPETNGIIKGKEAMRKWWSDAFDRLPYLKYHLLNLICNEKQIFMEYIRQTPDEEAMQVGEVLIIENGLIVASRVYHS